MLHKLFRILLYCMLLLVQPAFAQQENKYFRNISVEKGLSQSTVFAITQDTLGFIWVGTQDGLNRYNSKGFKVYRPVDGDSKSLQSYAIRGLLIDKKGSLWVGGNRGISRYNYATDSFINYKLPHNLGEWYISAIAEDAQHNIWASSIAGDVFCLYASKSTFVQVNFDALASGIKKIGYLGVWQSRILLGTDVGLFKLEGNKLSKIALSADKPNINEILKDGNKLWIATEGDGLLNIDISTGKTDSFKPKVGQNSIADNNIRCITEDAQHKLWIGTFRGLSIFDPTNGQFENYQHQVSQPYTISQNSVRCIFRDKQNGMWLGTYYGGINYYHQNDIKFNLLSQNTGALSLNDQVVSSIKQDANGNFWIGTNDKGLNYWNRANNTMRYFSYHENNANSLGSNNVKAIAFDNQGNVLVGTHNGGLNVLNPATGSVKRYLHHDADPQSISGNLVYAILKDYKNRIWVGTRSGLDQFDAQTQTFAHLHLDKAGKRLISDDITYLFEDSKHRIWIGTSNGVTQFYPDNMLFGNVANGKLSEDVVNCITEDKKQRIWIGTRGGLSIYNEASRSFITYKTRKDFLKGTIYGIQPDDEGNLWISTNTGLVRFDPDRGTVQSFDESDGLQSNQFNEYAFGKAKDGMLLFGGIKGISYFYPALIKQQPLSLSVRFTGLEVFNKMVEQNDGTSILSNHIDQLKTLSFEPEYKQFTIYFNSFNYISANRTHYWYKLEGFDTQWQKTDDIKVSYSNLHAGNYQFLIKVVDPTGKMSITRSLKIVMLPPWYSTAWFYLLLLCLVAAAAYITYRIVSERIRAVDQLKLERLDKERVSYINQIKMDFFTNISHELRTPLTLILAPLEELLMKNPIDKVLKKQYELMLTNAKRLYQLVDQLFEFKKTELGTRQLKLSKSDMVSFIHDAYVSFRPLSEKNQIDYTFHATEAKLSFPFDKDAMERILFNLLSNAFKYTKTGDEVKITLSAENDFAVITVSDSGIGIEKENLTKVFDRFYQVNNQEANLGSGVGLAFAKRLVELHYGTVAVTSVVGQGSTFKVLIPMVYDFYTDNSDVKKNVYELSVVPDTDAINNLNEAAEPEVTNDGIDGLKMLIVDDNKEIITYLSGFFSDKYEVYTAENGKLGLELLENQPVDVIISDVMMPEMDGLHFCKRVKQNINTSHIPLILLTAKTGTEEQIKGVEMGADDYMAKPFSIQLLDAKILNLLRSRKRLKQYYSESKEIIPENIAFNALDEEFLKDSIAVIEKHLSDSDFSVDKFSREIGMSRSNLYLKLKAITGESATDFIKRTRFKKAIELMESKRYTIAQIAYMCGFNSPSYFSTAFKQHFGCMPSEYFEKKV